MNWDPSLRIRHIRTFLEVARWESVSRAAQTLNTSQPAVSRTLRELETILGQPLFDRVGRGLALNATGRTFQAHATASMTELIRGRDRVQRAAKARHRLSVGTLPTAATELVPRAVLSFLEADSSTEIHVLTGPNWLLFNQLRDGQLDLVVGRMPQAAAIQGLLFEQLYIEEVVLVARTGHPIGRETAQRQLTEYPLVLPPKGAVIYDTVATYLSSIGLTGLRGRIDTVSLAVGRRLVETSDALWFISRGVVADEIARGRLVSVDLNSPLLSGPVGISQLQSAPIRSERGVFVECLRAVAARGRGG
ncbi:MAG: pca operon transcription factor PcaQ [Pseudomonadota bacterium]